MHRAAILLGLGVVLGSAGASSAAAPPTVPVPAAEKPVLVSADQLQYDQDLGLTIAKGHVELDENDQILLADAVTYNQRTDTVTASGHVSLLQPSGDIIFANYVELHDRMRDGFIKDIRILLSDRSRLAGNTGRRVNGTRTEIRRAVYSPCALCRNNPSHPPVWQLKAEEVVHDEQLKIVEYRDAIMEIDGVPVFYVPYLSHPDPSVKRASGFLVPTVGYSNTLGFHATVPYYWVIAPDKDATFRPMITTSAGVVLDGEYRQRFGNGYIQNDGSIEVGGGTQPESAANIGPPTGPVRGHLFGTGELDLTGDWRAGYEVQRASDQTYMLRYHFTTPSNYLTTHVFAERFGPDSYGNVSALSFQSLNPLIGDSVESIALPVASYDWRGPPDAWGGRMSLSGNALNLMRRTGPEERRLSTGAAWMLPFNGLIGDRFTFTASARSDVYYSDHVALTPNFTSLTSAVGTTVQLPSNVNTSTEWAGRVFPSLSLKWRYPWVRNDAGGSALVEPIAAVIANPNGENPARIPNVDSQGFEFDEMSLFVPNRLPGYDLVDSGQRVDYGLHGELQTHGWGNWETLVGQSYRFQRSTVFAPGSGLDDRLSDIVGRAAVVTGTALDFLYRFRLDKSDLAMRRQEIQVSTGPKSLRASVSFISISATPASSAISASPGTSGIPAGNQIGVAINAELTRTWSLALNDTRSFGSGGATIGAGVSLTYRDDCFAVVTALTQSGIRVGDVRPGVSVLVTLVFKNLGEVGERVFSASGT
jgi:LPS-assembly protein